MAHPTYFHGVRTPATSGLQHPWEPHRVPRDAEKFKSPEV